jgi:hypothetical protein
MHSYAVILLKLAPGALCGLFSGHFEASTLAALDCADAPTMNSWYEAAAHTARVKMPVEESSVVVLAKTVDETNTNRSVRLTGVCRLTAPSSTEHKYTHRHSLTDVLSADGELRIPG